MVLMKLLRMKTTYFGFQRMCQVAYQLYVIVQLVKYYCFICDSNLHIAVDTKNTLESTKEDAWLNQTVKPPANLVVLEGDCLDASGDNGELDSYLVIGCYN